MQHDRRSLNRTALSATVHCLTGCAIGEVLGMVLGTALGLGTSTTVVLAVVLAFFFGYSLTMLPLLRAGLGLKTAAGLAFASDTASIALMEVVDNVIMLYIPGAMEAGEPRGRAAPCRCRRLPAQPLADQSWHGPRGHPRPSSPLRGAA